MSKEGDPAIYAAVFASSPEMRCVVGLDGTIRAMNEAWERRLGVSAAALIKAPLLDIIHPDDRASVRAALRAIAARAEAPADSVETRTEHHFEGRVLRPDGAAMMLAWTATPAFEQGIFFASAEEITAKRDDLRRFRALAEASPSFIGIGAMNGEAIYINPAGRTIAGRLDEPLDQLRVKDFWPAALRTELTQEVLPTLMREGVWRGDVPLLRPDGAVVPLSRITMLLRDSAGRVEATATIARDITAELRESKILERLRTLTELTTDLIATSSMRGERTYVNPAGMAMLGRAGEDSRALRLRDVLSPSWREHFREHVFPTVLSSGIWSGEAELLRKDGGAIPVSEVVILVRDDAGEPQGLGTIARDISEHRRLTEALKRAARALSTPILEVWRGVLALPVVGDVDAPRAAHMTEALLESVVRTQARVAVLDLTGVPEADAEAVHHLLKMAQAAALLGSRCVLSGISARLAAMIAQLDVDLSGLHMFATLEEALRFAMRDPGAPGRQPARRAP